MVTRAEIEKELHEIHQLEFNIETRITKGLKDVHDNNGELLSPDNINKRIKAMAAEFAATCQEKNPVLVTVMEGASRFASLFTEELRQLNFRFQTASISTTSYHGTTAGELTIVDDEKLDVGCRPVYLLEDVIDKGVTFEKLKEYYISKGVSLIEMIALIDKKQPRKSDAKLTGFTIAADEFIVGMGLDFDGLERNVNGVMAVDVTLLPTDEEKAKLSRKRKLNEQLCECIAAAKDTPVWRIADRSRNSIFSEGTSIKPVTTVDQYTQTEKRATPV